MKKYIILLLVMVGIVFFAFLPKLMVISKEDLSEYNIRPVTYMDINNDGYTDKIVTGFDCNKDTLIAETYLTNPDSTFMLNYYHKFEYEKLTIDDFFNYGQNGLNSEGNPEIFLQVDDTMIPLSKWVKKV